MTKIFSTRIDLSAEVRSKSIAILNQHLADTTDLFTQTKYAHWNVKGHQFIALHKLFDELAGQLTAAIDELAERVTALGGTATGTLRQAASASRLPEFPASVFGGQDTLTVLCDRFAQLGKSTRSAVDTSAAAGDADTADLLTGLSRDLDKALWFLEAHLQG